MSVFASCLKAVDELGQGPLTLTQKQLANEDAADPKVYKYIDL